MKQLVASIFRVYVVKHSWGFTGLSSSLYRVHAVKSTRTADTLNMGATRSLQNVSFYLVFISFIRQTLPQRSCILVLFYTATCFGCSLESQSGRALVHKKSRKGEASPYKSRLKVIEKLLQQFLFRKTE